jgi:hypothetical protein
MYLRCTQREGPKNRLVASEINPKSAGWPKRYRHTITCNRLASLSDIPGLPAPAPSPPPDRTQKVTGNLLNRKEARPRTVKTLTAFIKAQLNNQATDVAVGQVLAQL